jgi:hypothetical protein
VKKNVENQCERLKRCSKPACFDALHWERCALSRITEKSSVTKIVKQIFAFNFSFCNVIASQPLKLYYLRPTITQKSSVTHSQRRALPVGVEV